MKYIKYLEKFDQIDMQKFRNQKKKTEKIIGKYVRIYPNIYNDIYHIAKVEKSNPDYTLLTLSTFNKFTKKAVELVIHYNSVTDKVTPEEIEEFNFQLTANKYNIS